MVSFRAAGPGSAGVSPAIALADCNVSRRTLGNSTSRAFTLVELLTSMAVLAILATITIGAVRGVKERASIAQARADLAALSTALEEFKRHFGDYPQLGEFGQAPATPTGVSATMPNGSGPGINTVPAKLFNCLTGVFGARAFGNADRVNGPNFLPPQLAARNRINGNLTTSYLVPVSNVPNPPSKTEQNVSLLDPWGRRYLYYYKNARNPNNWQATGYVLFSAGSRVAANGTQTPPINVQTGIFLPTQTPEMVDNIYSH
ncbi:MAG: prepilin-type N-terminal cleavage/methylation domain-containing protein [Opitutaceae bacterium]|nr:prepilin-type N-terminal cleavage/methylation domain-containing protein [Opitutaceae bacterium]